MNGSDDFLSQIENLKDAVDDIEGHHHDELGDLFTPNFLNHYTEFNSIEEFFNTAGISVEEVQNYEDNSEKLDPIAVKYANFKTFKDLIAQAVIDKTMREHGISSY